MTQLHKLIKEENHKEAFQCLKEMENRTLAVMQILHKETKEGLMQEVEPSMIELLKDSEYEIDRNQVLEAISMGHTSSSEIIDNIMVYYDRAVALDMHDAGLFQARMNEIEQDARFTADVQEAEKAMMGVL